MIGGCAPIEKLTARCCVVGGGPAGMMTGYLLARAGVEVVVLEKHADFLRDFRGDTIHPSTLQILEELGLLESFLRLPYQRINSAKIHIGDTVVTAADFSTLKVRCPFIALMPQWDFLKFLSDQARKFPTFRLRMETEAEDILQDQGKVAGIRARTKQGVVEIRADLIISADGRHSIVREKAGFQIQKFGVPIDVLWMRIPKDLAMHEHSVGGYIRPGSLLVLIDRGDYFQCGYVIRKGQYESVKQNGIEALRQDIASRAPFLTGLQAPKSWDDVKLLSVTIDRLKTWYREGLLCIGDAAHAMSPAGGVGINLAIQDAVAAANILAEPLLAGPPHINQLRAVQSRREFPAKLIQALQRFIHNRSFGKHSTSKDPSMRVPAFIISHIPFLRYVGARLIGLGFRPEHVRGRREG